LAGKGGNMSFPVFASGDVLNASDMNAVGLWLVKTQTIGSAVSSVAVTGAFSSDYDNYKIIISGGASSAQSFLTLQLGASTTGYYYANAGVTYAGAAFVGGASNGANFQAGSAFVANGLMANVELQNPFLAKYTFAQSSGMNTTFATPSVGYHGVATSYTGFTIAVLAGTMTGGTIKIYGYRN
jgi:hypothetical protein